MGAGNAKARKDNAEARRTFHWLRSDESVLGSTHSGRREA